MLIGNKDLNSLLSKVKEDSLQVSMSLNSPQSEIDFNNFNNQKTLYILDNTGEIESCSLLESRELGNVNMLDESIKNQFKHKLVKAINKTKSFRKYPNIENYKRISNQKYHLKTKKASLQSTTMQIVGNIKDKVSYLAIENGKYELTKGDLDCDNVYLFLTNQINNNYKVKSKFFIQHYYDVNDEDLTGKGFLSPDYTNVGEYQLYFEGYAFQEMYINCYSNYFHYII